MVHVWVAHDLAAREHDAAARMRQRPPLRPPRGSHEGPPDVKHAGLRAPGGEADCERAGRVNLPTFYLLDDRSIQSTTRKPCCRPSSICTLLPPRINKILLSPPFSLSSFPSSPPLRPRLPPPGRTPPAPLSRAPAPASSRSLERAQCQRETGLPPSLWRS